MGVTLCATHGKTGMMLACSHIRERASEHAPIGETFIAWYADEEIEELRLSLVYCRRCAANMDLPSRDDEFPIDRFDEDSGKGFLPLCYQCFLAGKARFEDKK